MAMAALGRITDYWDEALAVGLGIVVVDMLSDRVAGWLSKWVPEKWLDVATEGVIGLGLFVVGEWLAPAAYKVYTRLAAFGALGLAVAHAIKALTGLGGSPSEAFTHTGGTQASPVRSGWPYEYQEEV